jgi:hypothetical protein
MIILKANIVNLFLSSVLFVFWYHSPNVLDTPHIWNISRLRVKERYLFVSCLCENLLFLSFFQVSCRNCRQADTEGNAVGMRKVRQAILYNPACSGLPTLSLIGGTYWTFMFIASSSGAQNSIRRRR